MKFSMALRMAITLAALGSAGLAVAQGPGAPGFGGHKPPMERALGPHGDHGRWWNDQTMIDKLKLTDEQRKAMDGILIDHRTKLIDLHANLEKAELAMEPLMSADQPNESAILAQIDKVATARAELEKANARFLLAIRGKLTPEQWKTLQADRKVRMDRRGPGREGREGRPMPPPPGPVGMVDDDGPDDAQPANGLPQ
jgi:periplasmic protein CpxP/Spy